MTVLDETKTVSRVETPMVQERETGDGKLVEVSRNYLAITPCTNTVSHFGKDPDIRPCGSRTSRGRIAPVPRLLSNEDRGVTDDGATSRRSSVTTALSTCANV